MNRKIMKRITHYTLFLMSVVSLSVAAQTIHSVSSIDNSVNSANNLEDFESPEQAFPFQAHVEKQVTNNKTDYIIKASWGADEGYHLYYDKFFFASKGAVLGVPQIPHGVSVTVAGISREENKGIVNIAIPIERINVKSFELIAVSQGCADGKICYPPQTKSVKLTLPN